MLGMSIVVLVVLNGMGVNNDCYSFGICCRTVCDYLLVFATTTRPEVAYQTQASNSQKVIV